MYYTWPFFLNFYEFPFLTVISDHERWMKFSKKNYFNNQVKNRFGGLCFDPKNSLDLPKKDP